MTWKSNHYWKACHKILTLPLLPVLFLPWEGNTFYQFPFQFLSANIGGYKYIIYLHPSLHNDSIFIYICFFKRLLIHLNGRVTEKEGKTEIVLELESDTERERVLLLVHSQNGLNGQSRDGLKPGAGISSGSPMWVAGAHLLVPSSSAFLSALERSWIRSKAARTWTSAGTWMGCWRCRR